MKTVLVVDDRKINRIILNNILQENYYVVEAKNGQEALDVLTLDRYNFSAILLDLNMSVMNGYDFMERVKEYPQYNNIPIIVVTSNNSVDSEKEALNLGAWDYIIIPFDPQIVLFTLKNAIERSQIVAYDKIRYLAEYDSLCDIFNKKKFFTITEEIIRCKRDTKYAFVRFDIKRFSVYNSFYGIEKGDKLLISIANILKSEFGVKNTLSYGRVEADIFAFCISYSSFDEVTSTIKDIVMKIKKLDNDFELSCTTGVYLVSDCEESASSMYEKANFAAKSIKQDIIKKYMIYDEKIGQHIYEEQQIINEMNKSLENKEFIFYLQPKYDLSTNKPAGAEALVRWLHPEKGLISPAEFIPVFETNGFITKVDQYIWKEVCKTIKRWMDEGRDPQPISVNVSRVNLYSSNFVEKISSLVDKYSINPKYLNLELTETIYVENSDLVREKMDALHKKGFKIFMDDFGRGYSSLNVLKDIDIDVLKIDMGFFSKHNYSERGKVIVTSVIKMAKALNIPTIAEGVEEESIVNYLKEIGCEYVQGFYFSKPISVEDYEKLVY